MAYKYFFAYYMYQSLIWKLQYIISNMNFLLSIYQSLSNDVYARNLWSFAELVSGHGSDSQTDPNTIHSKFNAFIET